MSDTTNHFQSIVAAMLLQHQSVLDILSKGQETSSKVNRAVVKAVTTCGCISIHASKITIPENATLYDLKQLLNNHIQGSLCENCRDVIEAELGKELFYLTALINTLGLSLSDILEKETAKLNTLGIYNLV
ncbi:hypothetical protein Sgly_0298 [Syntrophobotulus glycolicus DSM 8271]|uniref:DUF1573 domain-containing protein n=1 Tax=Syntrophobotulus glycolicus (strain DSM 8271 / FlGlyR) TaxID=645991 RepID=F0SWX5_SYNGF|nr:hypothetical protein [Syntrophobotulus glycolicus]ADY54665.1 hypothetical protein Sgly_0298 [Syntrophobotulus glycolicus DSM 8271]